MKSFKELEVWSKSFVLVKDVYKISKLMPESEKYGLASQMQRCAISIPSNIAEGQQRAGSKEFANFLSIARGSAAELYTQLLNCSELYNIDCTDEIIETETIQKMLYSLQNKIIMKYAV